MAIGGGSPGDLVLLAILIAASTIDMREHRIPNFLSLGGVATGLAMAALGLSSLSVSDSLLGLAMGFGALVLLYAKNVMGAGDVKLMMAVGTFFGPSLTFWAVLYTFIAGGIMGIAVLINRDGLKETADRYFFGLKHLVLGGAWLGKRVDPDGDGPLRFPYAAAIFAGAVAAKLLWSPSV